MGKLEKGRNALCVDQPADLVSRGRGGVEGNIGGELDWTAQQGEAHGAGGVISNKGP